MKGIFLGLMALLILVVLGAFAAAYTVRFTETAVVTRAGARVATIDEPGLRGKIPLIDAVTTYDKRLRLLRTASITQQAADNSQLILEAFALYRVSDPYVFFQRFRNRGERADDHFQAAEGVLNAALVSALPEVSAYSIEDLFTSDPEGSKLPELEARILESMRAGAGGEQTLSDYGVEVTMVGINRVMLPADTTEKVVDRMGAERDRLAQEIESQGAAEAAAIEASAEADAEKIRLFAERRASEIIALGEAEAAEYLSIQQANEDLATFLRQLEFMEDAMAKRFTLVLPSSSFGMGLFSPSALEGLQAGDIPVRAPARDGIGVADREGSR